MVYFILIYYISYQPGHLTGLADNSVSSHQGWCHLKVTKILLLDSRILRHKFENSEWYGRFLL